MDVNTITGQPHSFNIVRSDVIDVSSADFSLPGYKGFYIKNNASDPVTVYVKYEGNDPSVGFIATTILPGWNNPEKIVAVQQDNATLDLQWGY